MLGADPSSYASLENIIFSWTEKMSGGAESARDRATNHESFGLSKRCTRSLDLMVGTELQI
jgi:hypothetical protein